MAAQADPSVPTTPTTPPWSVVLTSITDLLKSQYVGGALLLLVGGFSGWWFTKPAPEKPKIQAADLPSIVTADEFSKAYASITARLEANRAALAEVRDLIKSAAVPVEAPVKARKK